MLCTLALFALTTTSVPADTKPVEVLAQLASSESEVLLAGVKRAAHQRHPAYFAPLRGLLAANNGAVSIAAARTLGTMGVPDTEAELHAVLDGLMAAVDGDDVGLAIVATEALGRFPFLPVRQFLTKHTQNTTHPAVRQTAVNALRIDSRLAEAQLRAFVAVTNATPTPLDPATTAARDLLAPETSDRSAALKTLIDLVPPDAVRPFVGYALRHSEAALRKSACTSLSQSSLPEDRAHIVSALSRETDAALRLLLVHALHRISGRLVTVDLATAMQTEKDAHVLGVLSANLMERDPNEVLDALDAWPVGIPGTARRAGIEVLSVFNTPRATTIMVRWLVQAEEPATVRKAQLRLSELSDDRLIAVVMPVLKRTENIDARARLWFALRGRVSESVAGYAIAELDAQHDVAAALAYLQSVPPALIGDDLPRLYAHPDQAVRQTALRVPDIFSDEARVGLQEAIVAHPTDDALFERFSEFPETATRDARLKWLADPKYKSHHAQLLRSFEATVDPRLANATLSAVKSNPGLAAMGVALVGRQPPESAAPALDAIAGLKAASPEDRAAAVVALSRLGRANKSRIVPHARDEALKVRHAARNALHRLEPSKYPSWDPYGRVPLVLEGGILGAGLLLLAGDIADAELSPFFTASVGAVLGAATPFLLSLEEDITLGQAGAFGTYAAWGTGAGWGLAQTVGWSGSAKSWSVVGGELLGVAAGSAMVANNRFGLSEVALVNATAVETGLLAASISALVLREDERRLERSTGIGLLAGTAALVPLGIIGRSLQVRDDPILMTTTTLAGASIGAMTPGIFMKEGLTPRNAAFGAIAGQAVGFVTGLTLAQFTDLDAEGALWTSGGAGLGALSGAGMHLVFENADPRLRAGLLQGATVAGAVSFALLHDRLTFKDRDIELITLAGIAGAVMGADFSDRAAEGRLWQRSQLGGAMLGLGVGTVGGLVLSQYVDLSARTLYGSLLGAGTVGAGGFGLGRMIPGLSRDTRSWITNGSLAAGLILTAPFAETLQTDAPHLAYAGLTASLLSLNLAMAPVLWNEDNAPTEEVGGGALAGATLGMAGGLALSQVLDLEMKRVGEVALMTGAGTSFGAGLGLLLPQDDDRIVVGLAQGAGILSFAGATWYAMRPLRERGPRPDLPAGEQRRTATQIAAFSAHGAAHGALLSALWADGELKPRRVGGGLLLGVSAGGLLGAAVRGLAGEAHTQGDLLESSLLTVPSLAIGAGFGLLSDNQNVVAASAHGLALVGYAAALSLSPRTHYQSRDALTLAWLTPLGAGVGVAASAGAKSRTQGAGALIGAGAASLAAVALTQLDPDRDDAQLALNAAGGAALLSGVGLLTDDARWGGRLGAGGAVAGLVVASLVDEPGTWNAADGLLLASLSAAGAWQGLNLSPLWRGSDTQRAGGALMGLGVGYAAAQVIGRNSELRLVDVAEFTGFSGAATLAGAGASLLAEDSRVGAGLAQASGVLGLGAAAWLANSHDYTVSNAISTSLSASVLGVTGMFAAEFDNDAPPAQQRTGGAMLGAGLGTLAGAAMTQWRPIEGRRLILGGAASAAGPLAAWGLTDLAGLRGPARAATYLGFGVGSLGLAHALAPASKFSDNDFLLLGFTLGAGAWHGVWSGLAYGRDNGRPGAGLALGTSAGLLAGVTLAHFSEVGVDPILEGATMGALASSVGAGVSMLADGSRRSTLTSMQVAGAVGLASGLTFSRWLDFDKSDAALVGAGTLYGAGLGLALPVLAGGELTTKRRVGGILVGAGASALVTGVAAQWLDLNATQVLGASGSSLVGHAAGLGAGLSFFKSSRARLAAMEIGGVAGLGAGLVLAPMIEPSPSFKENLALGATWGSLMGLGTAAYTQRPRLTDGDADVLGGGALMGTTVGLAAGLAIDQWLQPQPRTVRHAAVGAGLGALAGGGVGILISDDDRVAAGMAQGLSLAGAAGLALTLDRIEVSPGDIALGGTYVTYLTWHAMGVTLLLDGDNRQAAGAVATTLGLGALTGMYLVPAIDMDLADTLMLLAGNMWGSWIGGWGGRLLERSATDGLSGRRQAGLTLLSTVLGSDVGLALTGLIVGGVLDVKPARFAFINLGGLAGMVGGMLVASGFKEEPLGAGNVIGSLSGLVLGAVVTSFFDWSDSKTWDQLLGSEEEKQAKKPSKKPQVFALDQWMPGAEMRPGPDGESQYMFSIQGTFQ